MTKKSILSNCVLTLDIFSLPIWFTIGNDLKAKRTLFGGILTIIIGVSSFAYLVYLCNIYFSNMIQPTISTTNEYFKNEFEMNIHSDMIGFRILLPDGQYLQDIEAKAEKKYLSFLTNYTYTEGGNVYYEEFLSTPCINENLKGYMCINMKSIKTQKEFKSLKLKYFDTNTPQNLFNLIVAKCDKDIIEKGEICESDEVIKNALFSIETQFQVKILTKQFNPIKKSFEDKVLQESYLFDDILSFVSSFEFQNVQTRISDGFLIQSTRIENNFSEYKKSDSSLSQQYLKRIMSRDLFGGFYFSLGTYNIIQSYQYAQFSSILAQFISVLNSLLIVGVICRRLAEFEIIYYKKTALSILKINQKNTEKSYEFQNKCQVLKQIQDSNMKQKVYDYFKIGFVERLKMIIFFKKEIKQKQGDTKEVKNYKQLLQLSQKSLNIYQIQQELLKIKMMLRLIFTAEQYAAIQMCGCQIWSEDQKFRFEAKNDQNLFLTLNNESQHSKNKSFEIINIKPNSKQLDKQKPDKEQESKPEHLNSQKNLNLIFPKSPLENTSILCQDQEETIQNHLETLEQLDNDQNLLHYHINKFLVENKAPQSELDKRILQSMIGIDYAKENYKF